LLLYRYIQAIGIISILADRFSSLKKSSKGTPLRSVFHLLLLFFIAGTIVTEEEQLLSSHSAKRFFRAVSHVRVWLFRKILQQVSIWRLNIEKPEIIKIGLDTMVLDKDDDGQIVFAYARDELVNRALKDFGTEHLPFKRFTSNFAYYYLMAISFFIFEAFKKNANSSAVEITWYA